MGKGQNQTEEERIIFVTEIEQVLQSMRFETEAPSYADITALIESNIEDILFDDAPTPDDIYIANLFEFFEKYYVIPIYLIIMLNLL